MATDTPTPADSVELLPCPFDGGQASAEGRTRYTDNHEAWWPDGERIVEAFYVNCMTCGCTNRGLIGHRTRNAAITAWNTRLSAESAHADGWRHRFSAALPDAKMARERIISALTEDEHLDGVHVDHGDMLAILAAPNTPPTSTEGWPSREAVADGMVLVPREPTEAQWGGLARAIVMWMDMEPRTPRALFKHLERSGHAIPQWLRDESEMQALDHVPSKGTRAVLIYRAMIAAATSEESSNAG